MLTDVLDRPLDGHHVRRQPRTVAASTVAGGSSTKSFRALVTARVVTTPSDDEDEPGHAGDHPGEGEAAGSPRRRNTIVPKTIASTEHTAPATKTNGIHPVVTPTMPSTIAAVARPSRRRLGVPNGSTKRRPAALTSAVQVSPLK